MMAMTNWLRLSIVVAAIFATSFPILYAFSPWYTTSVGRVLMLQSASLAFAMDITLLFQYWHPSNSIFVFWVEFLGFNTIALATGSLTWLLWRTNYTKHNLKMEERKHIRKHKIDH